MEPTTAFVLGALIASVKGIGLVAIGAGIAWWRARRRVRELEAQLAAAALPDGGDLARLEQGIDYLGGRMNTLAEQQQTLLRRLSPGGEGP